MKSTMKICAVFLGTMGLAYGRGGKCDQERRLTIFHTVGLLIPKAAAT